MFASLILGMGLPTTANYLVTSTIAAPALVQAGVPLLPAHLFVFYFGIIADLTPARCPGRHGRSGHGEGRRPMETAVQAFKLGAPAYLIPYVFALAPQITLVGYSFSSGSRPPSPRCWASSPLASPSWGGCSRRCHGGRGCLCLPRHSS